MTVRKLHKILSAVIAQGHGAKRICVNKPTFTHACEIDGCVILEVEEAKLQTVPLIDSDGGTAVNAHGQERHFTALVLDGGTEL